MLHEQPFILFIGHHDYRTVTVSYGIPQHIVGPDRFPGLVPHTDYDHPWKLCQHHIRQGASGWSAFNGEIPSVIFQMFTDIRRNLFISACNDNL